MYNCLIQNRICSEETLKKLKNIPVILSQQLLKVLCEMGHGDRLVIGDGIFPAESMLSWFKQGSHQGRASLVLAR